MRENIEAIIFDMDGVLINSMQYHAKSFVKCLSEVGVDIEPDEVYVLEGEGSYQIIKQLTSERGLNFGQEILQQLVDRKREIYNDIEDSDIFQGMKDLVANLSEEYELCVVSGSNRKLVEKYIETHFRACFDFYVSEDDVDKQKPNPEPYLKALEKLDLKPEECIVIENAPKGVESAKEAGLYCITVASYVDLSELKEADKILENHEELINFVEEKFL